MSHHLSPDLPDESTWRFDDIACAEPARVLLLESAGSPAALLQAVGGALDTALTAGTIRLGTEQRSNGPANLRVVVQFPVGLRLFDWFFNARTGYRAHFRTHRDAGLDFNRRIIEVLRSRLDVAVPVVVLGRQLDGDFKDCGPTRISKEFLMSSITQDLSKVWFCTELIGIDGGTTDLPTGIIGRRILLEHGTSWAAPYRDDLSAWLDVKGAFVGEAGPYQLKDPKTRAETLQVTGTA